MWNNYVNNNDIGYGGNIGIGLTFPNLPNYTLDVAGDINFTGTLYQNGTEFVSGGSSIWTSNNDNTIYYLTSNVGIGTTNPSEKLHVEGNIKNTGDIISPSLVGQVSYFATTTPPVGWLKCNGASLNRTTYSALFNVIGTTFGSDDANTFKVPDLRGEFIRSWVDDGIIDSGRTFGSSQKGSINAIDQGDNAVLGLSHTSTSTTTTLSDYGYDVYWDPTTDMKVKWNTTISGTATIRQATGDSGGASRPINTALLACIKY
jgi:microcystin-dependent protein